MATARLVEKAPILFWCIFGDGHDKPSGTVAATEGSFSLVANILTCKLVIAL
jgi:hypothetical protein